MGYVHDTAMSLFIGPEEAQHSAGTWTATNGAGNLWYSRRTAANATWVTKIPIKLPQNSVALKGSKLVSVDIYWETTVEVMDAVAAVLYKATAPANGSAFSAASVTTSYDTGHDTAAERVTVEQHTMTLTVTTPFWIDNDDVIYVELSVDGGANGVFDLYGARANFTLRV
jgi:hypothetical protein